MLGPRKAAVRRPQHGYNTWIIKGKGLRSCPIKRHTLKSMHSSSRGPAGFARMDFIGYLWVYQISVSCICELYYCHFASRPPCRPRPTHYPTGPTTPFCPDFTPTPKSYTRKTRVATTSTPPPTDSRDGVVGISTCSHRTTSPTGTTTA